MLVVDASVLIADLRPSEPHHPSARAILDRCADRELRVYSPEIAVAEVCSGLARGTRDPELALAAGRLLRRQAGLRFVAVDRELADRSARIAATGFVRGCDAVYLALADQLGCPLVSLDRQQCERAPDAIEALTPQAMLERMEGP